MLQNASALLGRVIQASDGILGNVSNLYFDEHLWRVRYLVARADRLGGNETALISPSSLRPLRAREHDFTANLTVDQVRNQSGGIENGLSRETEEYLSSRHGWPRYWAAEPFAQAEAETTCGDTSVRDSPLHSIKGATGFEIRAWDQPWGAGEISDFIVDDLDWKICQIVVRAYSDGGRWQLFLNPWWIGEIDSRNRIVHFDLSTAQIRTSPGFWCSSPPETEDGKRQPIPAGSVRIAASLSTQGRHETAQGHPATSGEWELSRDPVNRLLARQGRKATA